MKGGTGRNIIEIKDFTGGQVTRPPEKGIDPKFSVDCLNVYSDGLLLRRRDGYTVVNGTVTTGQGNGFYNWVKNATDQFMMVFFGSTLSKIDVVSNAWDGTLDTVSNDSANGTDFSNGIMHFQTFNGTLLMTTENRDKPQFMRVTDSSHFDLETNGAGTAPFAKYIQVWKNHVWLMNIGGGSELSEECSSITSWTDNDTGTGASVQTTFDGKSTFRLTGGSINNDDAKRTKDVGLFSDNFSFEVRTNFNTLNTIANGDYFEFNIYNGIMLFRARFSDDGLDIYDGSAFNEVGVNLVSEDSWDTWNFIVTGGTTTSAKVDIFKNNEPVGLQVDCSNASTANDGQIDLIAEAAGSGTVADVYIDYMYLNSVAATTNRFQNTQFEGWGPMNGSCATFSSASGSYLSLADHANFAFAANDFTIESFINFASTSTAAQGLYTQSTATNNQIYWHVVNGALVFSCVTNGVTIAYHSTPSLTWNSAQWYNVSLVRDGSALMMFRDGQNLSVSATTELGVTSLPDLSTTIYIGAIAGSAAKINAAFDEYRVSSSARFTAGYDITTSNYSSDSNTVLLLHLDSGFTDASASAHTITTANSVASATTPIAPFCWHATTSLTVAREGTTIKEGTYSVKLSGTGTFTQTMATPSAVSGTSFYVAGWVKPPSSGQYSFYVTDGVNTYSSSVFSGASTAWEYRYLQFTTASSVTNITVNMNVVTSDTFYADSWALIPAGTVAYSSDFSDRVQRSAIGFYNDWSGTDSGTNDIVTPGDIGITGNFILNDRMYVTKAWSIHRFTYTYSFPLVEIKQVKKTVGTRSPRSIKNIDTPDGDGEMVLFLGTDRRLYLFNGAASLSISDEMNPSNSLSNVYFDNINSAALDKVFAVIHKDKNHYELFVPMGSSTTPDFSIIYDYVLKSLWPASNRNFTYGDVSDNGNGLRRVYALASTAGQIALLNEGNSDNSSSINSYWTSIRLGTSLKLNRIDEINVETPSQAAAPTITWRGDYESSFVATKSISSGTYVHLYAPGRIDNLIQFKIADNTTTAAWKVWSITLTERLIGVGN